MNCLRSFALAFAATALLNAAPQRIISTAPSITEMLFALGLGDRVVGVTQYCRYPKEVSRIPRIGSWTATNMEVVLAAKPDLIIVQKTAVHDAAKFRTVGLQTLEIRTDRIEDILSAIQSIAVTAGVPERGSALRASILRQLDEVRARVAGKPRPAALFVVGRAPGTLEGVIAAGGTSYLSEVMALAGGRNIFEDSTIGYLKASHEEILARNPEVIIDMGEHADAESITQAQKQAEIALWGRYASLRAVKNKRIHIVASEVFVVPGPRVVELAREMLRILHPELAR